MARLLTKKELGLDRPPLEREVSKRVEAVYRACNVDVYRTSNARKPKGITPGIPDLYLRHVSSGLRWWHEVKRPGEKPTEAQRVFAQRERMSGGKVYTGGADQAERALLELGIAEVVEGTKERMIREKRQWR